MATVRDIADWLAGFAPLEFAADWDNVGLLLGDRSAAVERVMTCLTVTAPVVEEAVAENATLIVSHHPVLFRGTKKLTTDDGEAKLLLPLLRHGIAVYSPHTAFDNCRGGINDGLAARLALRNVRPLRNSEASECKLVTFVPESDLDRVSNALFAAGAGHIGEYEHCSFRTPGTGTFFGSDASNPAVGVKGSRQTVPELRLEVVVPTGKVAAAVAALIAAHSYEEPAYDIYPLKPKPAGGEGRIGELAAPLTLSSIASGIKTSLRANSVQIVGDAAKPIRRIAVACGAAGEFLKDAIRAKANAFVTGEVRFHDALAAEAAGVGLILPGHYATERPAVEDLAAKLQSEFPAAKVWPSRRESDPLKTVV